MKTQFKVEDNYWSTVFSETVRLKREKPQIDAETAFWLAKKFVDESRDELKLTA